MSRRTRTYTGGSWETSSKGWLRWVEVDGTDRVGFIILRPVTTRNSPPPAPGVSIPTDHDVWVLSGLFVEPPHRGRGEARALLERGGAQLLAHVGSDVWLGLMTDNLTLPPGRTRISIRGVWESFLAAHPGMDTSSGFVLLTPSLGLGA